MGAKNGCFSLKTAYLCFGTPCAILSSMTELRLLYKIGKPAASALCALVVLVSVGFCAADGPATQPATQAATKPALGFGKMSQSPTGDVTGLIWQMMAATLVVLLFGAAALFVLKRVLPKIRSVSQKRICVLETAYLGSRKAVHLLQVGSVKLLVASSPDGVTRLEDVTGAFSSDYAEIAHRLGSRGGDGGSQLDSNDATTQ